jgi:hypothetical protein
MCLLLQTMINARLLMDAEAVVGGAGCQPNPGRTAQRNGCRRRDLDTLLPMSCPGTPSPDLASD